MSCWVSDLHPTDSKRNNLITCFQLLLIGSSALFPAVFPPLNKPHIPFLWNHTVCDFNTLSHFSPCLKKQSPPALPPPLSLPAAAHKKTMQMNVCKSLGNFSQRQQREKKKKTSIFFSVPNNYCKTPEKSLRDFFMSVIKETYYRV